MEPNFPDGTLLTMKRTQLVMKRTLKIQYLQNI